MNKTLYFENASKINVQKLGEIGVGQDGAIYNGYLFHIDEKGLCSVFKFDTMNKISEFVLDKCNIVIPHSNSVCFGSEYFAEGDEFPLFYSNIYNNYQNEEDRKEGTCLVYRILRNGNNFTSELKAIIKLDFTDDVIWCSENIEDIRPFGNFIIDNKSNMLYAFTMRDEEHKTRVFSFKLPKLSDGNDSHIEGVKLIVLNKADILDMFDCEYVEFMQGGSFSDKYIYSVNGFGVDHKYKPTLSIIDTQAKKTAITLEIGSFGLIYEPEMIEIYDGNCYFGDRSGVMYKITFE